MADHSLYVAEHGQLRRLRSNNSLSDSLGCFFSVISSTQGGWTVLSSEGRYMGAVAWGDCDRLTNPYYRRLRQIFHFGEEGQVHINRKIANWHQGAKAMPPRRCFGEIINGFDFPRQNVEPRMPILCVDNARPADATTDRVDLAAATQLVFEDVLFHVVDHLIRTTGSDQLVLTGGTALNCLANMHLADRYNEDWYRRNLKKTTRLRLWVPRHPATPAWRQNRIQFRHKVTGRQQGRSLQHAFWCGQAPLAGDIAASVETASDVDFRRLGNINDPEERTGIADLMAQIVAEDGVVGLFQGAAETGPRALGHRSILANPCNPQTPLRKRSPATSVLRAESGSLAPMATLAAALRFFELSPGGADDQYNAYNYMVLTAHARPEAYAKIPAVIHKDGTARVQIVREEHDPFTHAFLTAMGRRLGVEGVGRFDPQRRRSDPCKTPARRRLAALKRAEESNGMVMIADDGQCWFAWHAVGPCPEAVCEWTGSRTAVATA